MKLQSRKTASESNLFLKKKELNYNRGYFSNQNRTSADIKGTLFGSALRTSEPDSLAKNLFEDFDQPFKEPVDRHSAKKPLNSESVQSCVEGLEQSLAGMSLDERVAIEKQHTSHFDDKTDIENKKDCASMDSIPRVPTNLPPDSVLKPASRYSQSASNMFDGSSDYLGESELRTSVETPYTNVPHTDKPLFIHGYDLYCIFILKCCMRAGQ